MQGAVWETGGVRSCLPLWVLFDGVTTVRSGGFGVCYLSYVRSCYGEVIVACEGCVDGGGEVGAIVGGGRLGVMAKMTVTILVMSVVPIF